MRGLQKSWVVVLAVGLSLSCAATSYGDLIAMHSGATDPETELGLDRLSGTGVGTAVYGDLGTTDAWSVNDADTMIGHTFSAPELTAIDANGYSLSANVRFTAANSTIGQNTLYVRAADGGQDKRFVVWFTTDGDMIPTVRVHPQQTRTYNVGSAGYHEYKLLVDASGIGDLYVDGVERIANISPDPDDGNKMAGFTGSSANWNSFSLDVEGIVAPEPNSLALLVVGLIGLLAYAWRKRR
jgi:hypothetical protein